MFPPGDGTDSCKYLRVRTRQVGRLFGAQCSLFQLSAVKNGIVLAPWLTAVVVSQSVLYTCSPFMQFKPRTITVGRYLVFGARGFLRLTYSMWCFDANTAVNIPQLDVWCRYGMRQATIPAPNVAATGTVYSAHRHTGWTAHLGHAISWALQRAAGTTQPALKIVEQTLLIYSSNVTGNHSK